MLVIILFVCCILVVVVVAGMVVKSREEQQQKQQLHHHHHQNHHQPPGPSGLPIIGQGLQLDINSAHLQFTKWCKQFGDIFRFDIYGTNVVIFNSPESIRKAFCEFSELTSDRPGSFIGQYVAHSYKDILFRRYDDVCEKLKNVTLKAMYSSGIGCEDFIMDQQHIVDDYIKKIASHNGDDIDIIQDLELTLCRMIALLYTGKRMDDNDPVIQAIADFDRTGNELITPATHFVLKLLPFFRHWPGYYGNLYRRTMESKERLNDSLFNKMKEEFKVDKRDCFLHNLLDIQEHEDWLTDDFIFGVVMDLINTSTLTSRGVLSGIYFLLVHFQNVQKKISEEILEVIGTERQPKPRDMHQMPYTHACILEALRYQSHLGITATHTNTSDFVIDGLHVPRGSSLYGNLWNVHHDEKLWPDPFVFKPERFLQEDGKLLPIDHENRSKNFMPFGTGARSCMGVTTTYHRMFLFVTTLLQKHKLLPPSEGELPPHDPTQLIPGTVLQAPSFRCRIVDRQMQK